MFFKRNGRATGSTVRPAKKIKHKGRAVNGVPTEFIHPETLYDSFNKKVHLKRYILSNLYGDVLHNTYGLKPAAGAQYTQEIIRTQALYTDYGDFYGTTGDKRVLGPLSASMLDVLNGATEQLLKIVRESNVKEF